MVNDSGIVLNRTAYGDSALIVNVFTEQHGLKGFYIPNARSRSAKLKANVFQPLSPIQFTTNYSSTKGLPKLKEVSLLFPQRNTPFDPVKQTLSLFIAEVLDKCLTDQLKDERLFLWMISVITDLDESNDCSLFPHQFLLKLSELLGFAPDDTPEVCFDLADGCFKPEAEAGDHSLNRQESSLLHGFMISDTTKLSSKERSQLLQVLLRYFEYHVEGIQFLKSLEIIRAVYHS